MFYLSLAPLNQSKSVILSSLFIHSQSEGRPVSSLFSHHQSEDRPVSFLFSHHQSESRIYHLPFASHQSERRPVYHQSESRMCVISNATTNQTSGIRHLFFLLQNSAVQWYLTPCGASELLKHSLISTKKLYFHKNHTQTHPSPIGLSSA